MNEIRYPNPSAFAEEIAARQYAQKDRLTGAPLEGIEAMQRRTARHLARAEAIDSFKKDYGQYPDWYREYASRRKMLRDLENLDGWIAYEGYADVVAEWEEKFLHLFRSRGFSPGGRILAGAGTPVAQMMNCFVHAPSGRYLTAARNDPDSIAGIYELNYKLAETTKSGGGSGIWLGFLREKGGYVHGSAGTSSGPVSFLRLQYNPTLRGIRLGGVRRGAGMATLHPDHPDALDFITAKDKDREAVEGKIEAFNLSLLLTDQFMQQVQEGGWHVFQSVAKPGWSVPPTSVPGKYHLPWEEPTSVSGNPNDPPTSKEVPLCFVCRSTGVVHHLTNPGNIDGARYRELQFSDVNYENHSYEFAVPARWLWGEIYLHAWETGDPGIIFIDRMNEFNPMIDHLGEFRATNPCGEENLYPGESCDLGSMILPTYVEDDPYLGQAVFRWERFIQDVELAIRALDDVLTMNLHPLEETQETCDLLRRVGLGVMGDADCMAKMGFGYASQQAQDLRQRIASTLLSAALRASERLASEKGPFPLCDFSSLDTPRRNVFLLSLAPTGTIAMTADCNSGIEPFFALAMQRRVGKEYMMKLHPLFEAYLRQVGAYSLDDEKYLVDHMVPIGVDASGTTIFDRVRMHKVIAAIYDNHGSIKGLDDLFTAEEQAIWVTAHDLTPEQHIAVQAAWQTSLDGPDMAMASISKTTNLPHSATPDEIGRIYQLAWESRLKGITIYRDGSREDQVLRTDSFNKEMEEDELLAKADAILMKRGLQITSWRELEHLAQAIPTGHVCAEKGPQAAKPLTVQRGIDTHGAMTKATFTSADEGERKVYVYVGLNDSGYPVEVFVTDRNAGRDIQSYAAALGITVSTALKHGVEVPELVEHLKGLHGESVSFTGGMYQSVPDLIAKKLEEAFDNFQTAQVDEASTEVIYASGTAFRSGLKDVPIVTPRIKPGEECPEGGEHEIKILGGCPVCVKCGAGKCG